LKKNLISTAGFNTIYYALLITCKWITTIFGPPCIYT